MKKAVVLVFLVLSIFLTFSAITACGTPPPAVEEEPPLPPTPPPPPPPPPPEPEPEFRPPPPPTVQVSYFPLFFSPDGDGYNDELTVNITIESEAPIGNWFIIMRDPRMPHHIFSQWRGEGMPPEILIWDGRSVTGELVESASLYNFTLTVCNIHHDQVFDGNIYDGSGYFQGTIQIDVLVHREGDNLRVIVPSIVFAPNTGNLTRLDPEVMANNDWILRRIADVLQVFDTYRVIVEGHANPTTPPGTRERTIEETGGLYRGDIGLQPLSLLRASAVADYLVNLGVDRSRLTPIGVGGARSITAFEDRDYWWRNRRVEFLLER